MRTIPFIDLTLLIAESHLVNCFAKSTFSLFCVVVRVQAVTPQAQKLLQWNVPQSFRDEILATCLRGSITQQRR
jgi:hypothetical protein